MASYESRLQDILNQVLKVTVVEEAFLGLVHQSHDEELNKIINCLENFKQFWKSLPQESHEPVMQYYVNYIHMVKSYQQVKLLCDILSSSSEKGIIPPKLICITLFSSEKLNFHSSEHWCQTFILVRKIIGGVDYKGCRDLLKLILDILQKGVPHDINSGSSKQIEVLLNVINYILDRNAYLLPSYFAVNEISKLLANGNKVHWCVSNILSSFVESFRQTACMVQVTGRPHLLPVVSYSNLSGNTWKLEPSSLSFSMRGPLPYEKELLQPQTKLLQYVLEQSYSRDMVCSMLALNKQLKQRCGVLEEQLVDLIVNAMEKMENNTVDQEVSLHTWHHLSSQLIFFVLFQFASFPHMVSLLYKKLSNRKLKKGRDYLMWVLLQFISGSIQKNSLKDFLPVTKLFDLLYGGSQAVDDDDTQELDMTQPEGGAAMVRLLAPTCIWVHLNKKAEDCKEVISVPMIPSLTKYTEVLHNIIKQKDIPVTDYRMALACNAYSTSMEHFNILMGQLVEYIFGVGEDSVVAMPGNCMAYGALVPLPMTFLDSLTVHTRMSLIHSIVTKTIRVANSKSLTALAPSLVETYGRLLVYSEMESLGIKAFISQLLPSVLKSNSWSILHTLLELFSYRIQQDHVQPHYRIQLLSHLHTIATLPQANHNQLYMCVESCALRLITGLGSSEVQPQLSRFLNEPKQLLSYDSEELNRALVLTLARAIHVTGSETLSGDWCDDILSAVMQATPHNWASHTFNCFPTILQKFIKQNPVQVDSRTAASLKKSVEEEYRRYKNIVTENELATYFSAQGRPPVFLCLLWKILLDTDRVRPAMLRVLENMGPKGLSVHIRNFADFLVYEFSTSAGGQHVNKCIETLNKMIWKYNILTLDRMVLSLALRHHGGNEAQVCFFIIQLLLLKPSEFRNRVSDFVKENSSQHYQQTDWYQNHMAYHKKYPERWYQEGLREACGIESPSSPPQYFPVYFSNVCLRFLPVFDIVVHRFLELPPVSKSLETLLDHLGGLYKFHDRPVTYLYNTLHYYEKKLQDRPALKRKLVSSILLSLKDIRPTGWCLSADYLKFIQKPIEEINWIPEIGYYTRLVERFVHTMAGSPPATFTNFDWRHNEFPNPSCHALHTTCVELMALPLPPDVIGNALLDIVLNRHYSLPREEIIQWMNAVALIFTALPEPYWFVVNTKIIETLKTEQLLKRGCLSPDDNSLISYNYGSSHTACCEVKCSYVLAFAHCVWHHFNIGQLTLLPKFVKESLKPLIRTEEQYLFLCHLVGPFLQRFHQERTRCLLEITRELYSILENVDKSSQQPLQFLNPICDFLYHIKYMFTGDGVKSDVEKVIQNLRQPLRMRLRFIVHLGRQ